MSSSSSKIQSVMFKKSNFTIDQAEEWLNRNKFRPIKPVDITKNYLRYRIRVPREHYRYRVIDLTKGVKATIQWPPNLTIIEERGDGFF